MPRPRPRPLVFEAKAKASGFRNLKMPLVMEVGLGPGHIMMGSQLHDPPPSKKGEA